MTSIGEHIRSTDEAICQNIALLPDQRDLLSGNLPGIVAIRDSKNPGGGAHAVSLTAFRAFVAAVADDGHPGRVR